MVSDGRADYGSRRRRIPGNWRWPRSSLLGSLAETSRERLLEPGVIREFPPDRRLMREGEPGAFVIVLLQGVVKATGVTSDGKEVLLAILVAATSWVSSPPWTTDRVPAR